MNRPFRIAIMGCGPGGSYLYRLLRMKKPHVDVMLFDTPHKTSCGIKPCAWGVNHRQFDGLCRLADVDAQKYILGTYDHILAGRMKVKADIAIIDKPLFIGDMLGDATPSDPNEADIMVFDRVVDATGVRAYLPPHPGGLLVDTIQIRARVSSVRCPIVSPRRDGGYSWLFPAGSGEAHIGSLSSIGIEAAAKRLSDVRHDFKLEAVLCSCTARVWRGGPVPPFVADKVWGLGESIGLVDPVPGAGIIPAMNSARLMMEHWDDAKGYEKHTLREYAYMKKEARIIARLAEGASPSFVDLLLPPRAYTNIGVNPNFRQTAHAVITALKFGKESGS